MCIENFFFAEFLSKNNEEHFDSRIFFSWLAWNAQREIEAA